MTVESYIESVPEERKAAFLRIRDIIRNNIPTGFVEVMNYGMIGYVVPHSIYPAGYHCSPTEPLPFLGLASQKNSISLYHMGIYQNEDLRNWFIEEWKKISKHKIDIGKSCIRFKFLDEIPFDALKELVRKITVEEWISIYKEKLKR